MAGVIFRLMEEGEFTLEQGRFHEVPTDDHDDCPYELDLPILSWKNIHVSIKYNGQLMPRDQATPMPNCTYPEWNSVLNSECLESTEEGLYTFTSKYPTSDLKLSSVEDAGNASGIEKYIEQADIPERLLKDLHGARNMGELLFDMMCDIGAAGSREPIDAYSSHNLSYLMREYESQGHFPGDCRAFSTVVVGVAHAIGLPARRIIGYVEHRDDPGIFAIQGEEGLKEPHYWSELFVPVEGGVWLLADAAREKFRNYPSDETYILQERMPRFEGDGVPEVCVEYV